jgi:hypothetical protein
MALWDVNHVVPTLEAVVDRMNQVQSHAAFEVVDISAPIGTWRRARRRGSDRDGFLNGQEVARRLRSAPRELGVDRLFGITSFRLGDDEQEDLYLWDADAPDASGPADADGGDGLGRIAIFSTYDLLDAMQAPGRSLERAIANAVVYTLTDSETHRRLPKTCPLYYNDERDPDAIAGPLAYDRWCRPRLVKRRVPVEELEKILTAFPAPGDPPAPPRDGTRRRRRRPKRAPAKGG